MKFFTQTVGSSNIVQAIVIILLGLFLAAWPETTTLTIVYLLALYLAITGVASLVAYFRAKGDRSGVQSVLASGLLFLVLALVVSLLPEVVAGMFSLLIGILLVLSGLVNVVRAVEVRNSLRSTWIGMLLVSIALAVGGVLIIVNPFGATVTFMLVLGILLIAKGVIDLVFQVLMGRVAKNQRRKPLR